MNNGVYLNYTISGIAASSSYCSSEETITKKENIATDITSNVAFHRIVVLKSMRSLLLYFNDVCAKNRNIIDVTML